MSLGKIKSATIEWENVGVQELNNVLSYKIHRDGTLQVFFTTHNEWTVPPHAYVYFNVRREKVDPKSEDSENLS